MLSKAWHQEALKLQDTTVRFNIAHSTPTLSEPSNYEVDTYMETEEEYVDHGLTILC